jgi:hypothetical protein
MSEHKSIPLKQISPAARKTVNLRDFARATIIDADGDIFINTANATDAALYFFNKDLEKPCIFSFTNLPGAFRLGEGNVTQFRRNIAGRVIEVPAEVKPADLARVIKKYPDHDYFLNQDMEVDTAINCVGQLAKQMIWIEGFPWNNQHYLKFAESLSENCQLGLMRFTNYSRARTFLKGKFKLEVDRPLPSIKAVPQSGFFANNAKNNPATNAENPSKNSNQNLENLASVELIAAPSYGKVNILNASHQQLAAASNPEISDNQLDNDVFDEEEGCCCCIS